MPKKTQFESVLHDWVHGLPFQQQALLLTAMRGPDNIQKQTHAKVVVRYLRGVVIKPAGDWEGRNDNEFMWGDYSVFIQAVRAFWADHDNLPHHFIMHLVHCAEVVAYKHPDAFMRQQWLRFYNEACSSFHMSPEHEEELDDRLNDFGVGYHNLKNNTKGDAVKA